MLTTGRACLLTGSVLEPSSSLLPMLDAFRIIDWKKVREELEELKLSLGIQ